MADYADEPFQMDEDVDPSGSFQAHVADEWLTDQNNGYIDGKASLLDFGGNPGGVNSECPATCGAAQFEPSALNSAYDKDDFTLQAPSHSQKRAEYDEDADDKVDVQEQLRLEKEFRANNIDVRAQALTPPENFAPVINNIYRSSFPQIQSFSFLRTLKLKSILCLIPEEYPQLHRDFFEEEGIQLFQMGMSGNKEPFVKIPPDLVTEAVKVVLDPRNQPILIHCNRGKHRTGCLVGVIRRLQRWLLSIIFDEYRKFAAPKERPMDQQFIELYNEAEIEKYARDNGLLPIRWD